MGLWALFEPILQFHKVFGNGRLQRWPIARSGEAISRVAGEGEGPRAVGKANLADFDAICGLQPGSGRLKRPKWPLWTRAEPFIRQVQLSEVGDAAEARQGLLGK